MRTAMTTADDDQRDVRGTPPLMSDIERGARLADEMHRATILTLTERLASERAAREKAEFRLRETEGWHRAAVRERDLMREQMDEILGYEDIETPGPDENVASVVLAAMEHLREAREKAERAAQTWRELCDHRASDLDKQEALLARAEAALREIRDELGVPQPGYPAPVANAANIARAYFAEGGR